MNKDTEERLLGLRILRLGEIKPDICEIVKENLWGLALKSADPITILIDSPGGSVPHGFSLIDLINMMDVPTTGIVNGICASMAVPVLQACNNRIMTKHSRLFLHPVSSTRRISVDEYMQNVVDDNVKLSEQYYKEYLDFVCKRASKTRDEIDRKIKLGDKFGGFMSASEALDWGLIDKIAEPDEFKLLRRNTVAVPAIVNL